MGCDIHAFVEVRKYPYGDKKRENGVWISADKWTVNPDSVLYPEERNLRLRIDNEDRIYRERNYDLFSILADVRSNGKLKLISLPKGLPDNVSQEVKQEADYWDGDAHSHSYLTLAELLNYNWDAEMETKEFVESREFAVKKYGEDVELESIFDAVDLDGPFGGVYVKHKVTLRDRLSEFMETIEKLKGFVEKHNRPHWDTKEEDIRLVFWFDN